MKIKLIFKALEMCKKGYVVEHFISCLLKLLKQREEAARIKLSPLQISTQAPQPADKGRCSMAHPMHTGTGDSLDWKSICTSAKHGKTKERGKPLQSGN